MSYDCRSNTGTVLELAPLLALAAVALALLSGHPLGLLIGVAQVVGSLHSGPRFWQLLQSNLSHRTLSMRIVRHAAIG